MTKTPEPWVVVGDDPRAGFLDTDLAGLPPDQAAWLRCMEAAERAEEREREERVAQRQEAAHNLAIAESIQRAHARCRAWDPSHPLRDYPTRQERTDMVFAAMDLAAASELRQAKAAAVKVLREHGVNAQVVVDASQPPNLPGGGSLEPAAAGEPQPTPGTGAR